MQKHIAIGVLLLMVVAGGAYLFITKQNTVPAESSVATTTTSGKLVAHDIEWKISETETDAQGTPHAEISVIVDGVERVVGTYAGVCQDIAISGSIDGSGLVEGELAAVQCYWAGSGDEIGVFADGTGTVIKVGELGEPTAESPAFRGNFRAI